MIVGHRLSVGALPRHAIADNVYHVRRTMVVNHEP